MLKSILPVNLFFVFYSVCLTFFFDSELRNIGLVLFIFLASIIIFLYRKILVGDIFLLSITIILILSSLFLHEEVRISSLAYSLIFFIGFLSFLRYLHISNYSTYDLLSICRLLILSYFIVLIIQQISVFLGLPVFNSFGSVNLIDLKFNSLSLEPSWTARIMGLLMYVFLRCQLQLKSALNIKDSIKSDSLIWFAFIWSMITSFSGTAIIFLIIIFGVFIANNKNYLFSVLIIIFLALIYNLQFEPIERAVSFTLAALTLDAESIISADHSGAYRIVPFILSFNYLNFYSIEGLFGYGVDFSSSIDWGLGTDAGAGILSFILDYGLIAGIIYIIFSIRSCVDFKHPSTIIFWFLLVMLYGVNFQIPWLCIMLLYTLKRVTTNQSKMITYE